MANARPCASLIKALQDPARYDHPVTATHLIETHISWIVLTGPYAYKIKKPVDLGFLDFSSLDKRRFYCEEELRLNRRFAPQLYLGVVRITGTPDAPVLNGPGDAIEYAVKMVQFPQEAQLDRIIARNALKARHIDWLAQRLAEIHAAAAVCAPDRPYGTPQAVFQPVDENFRQIGALLMMKDMGGRPIRKYSGPAFLLQVAKDIQDDDLSVFLCPDEPVDAHPTRPEIGTAESVKLYRTIKPDRVEDWSLYTSYAGANWGEFPRDAASRDSRVWACCPHHDGVVVLWDSSKVTFIDGEDLERGGAAEARQRRKL